MTLDFFASFFEFSITLFYGILKVVKNPFQLTIEWLKDHKETMHKDVKNITNPTINVLVAPALTKAKTTSKFEIGAANIS